ncbi:ATP-binding protein [Streptomyces flavidovirens]
MTTAQSQAARTTALPASRPDGSPERAPQGQHPTPDWGINLRISAAGFAARRITHSADALTRARSLTRHTLNTWGLGAYSDDALIITGELISNAIRHALPQNPHNDRAWLGLINHPKHLLIAVTDPAPHPPGIASPALLAETGRGLRIVETLADSWGWTPPTRTGKTVWAVIRTWPHRPCPSV